EPFRRLHLEHVLDAPRDVVERLDAERKAHAALGAELVDQQWVPRLLRVFEQERRPARLHRAVDDLRQLELRVDLRGDPNALALALEQRDPLAQVACRRHQRRVYESAAQILTRCSSSLTCATRTPDIPFLR